MDAWYDVFAIEVDVRRARLDDDCTLDAAMLLQPGVRVVPIGSRLPERELEQVLAARRDRRCGQVWDAVHFVGQEQTVPADGGFLGCERFLTVMRAVSPSRKRRTGPGEVPFTTRTGTTLPAGAPSTSLITNSYSTVLLPVD